MAKYRKKPVVIDAVQYNGTNKKEIFDFVGSDISIDLETAIMEIHTLEGNMIASKGDWIIKGVANEFYPCRADIFDATYEAVENKSQD